jgi:hypothetical protein
METLIAWGFVLGAGLGAVLGVVLLTRPIKTLWLRSLLRCLATVWLMLPAPIEVVAGQYAPAYVVALFESVFRVNGNPKPALAILLAGTAVVALIFILAGLVGRDRRRRTG